MLPALNKPTLFAHRGASSYAPENTLAAFELAIHQNADAIEFDVKLTADNQVIVIHDDSVNRTTNGKGLVSELDLATVKSLDAGQHFDDAFSGEKIPTLDEVMDQIAGRIYLNIEITNYSTPRDDLPRQIAKIIRSHNQKNQILFSSFSPISLLKTRKLLPDFPIGFLTTIGILGRLSRLIFGNIIPFQAIHPEVRDTNCKLIKKYHHKGQRVHTYTVNDFQTMVNLFRWNVDGIFTDDIPLAHKARTFVKEEK